MPWWKIICVVDQNLLLKPAGKASFDEQDLKSKILTCTHGGVMSKGISKSLSSPFFLHYEKCFMKESAILLQEIYSPK